MEKERQTYCVIAQFEASEGFGTINLSAGLSELEAEELVNSKMNTIVKSELIQYSVTGEKYIFQVPDLNNRCLKVLHEDDV